MKRLIGLLCGLLICAQAVADDAGSRVAAWAPSVTAGGPGFHAQTLRMVVHPSIGGTAPRLRVSNLTGSVPLHVAHATLGLQANGATPVAGSLRPLTVDGSASFTVPAGGEAWTDPAPVPVSAGTNLLVSLYLPDAITASTFHQDAFETTYATQPDAGDRAGDADASAFTEKSEHWYALSGLTVVAPGHDTLVAFGDSITDGYNTPVSANARWPDALARRLVAAKIPFGVVDAGIGGNRVLTDCVPNVSCGTSALARFDHDALSLPRVRTVILLEGINDIGNDAVNGGSKLTPDQLIAGYRQLIARAHAAHVRIIGATILPYRGAGYFSERGETTRQAANAWIRTSKAFDGVIDFDKAVRDPAAPQRLKAAYDAGDHLHPNAAGMKAMADAIDLRILR